MKILIVEDDFLIVAQIQECLERLGHEVLATFDDASLALTFVKNNKPDFVFMDIELNGPLDGIQCANALKNRYSIPSIFVTSHHETDILKESMAATPLNFLPKPFEDSNIEAVVALAEITLKLNPVNSTPSIIQLQDYEFNFEYKLLKKNDQVVKLTDKELLLVSILFKNIGNIVSKEEIGKYVYEGNLTTDSSLRRLVSRTRDKLPGLNIQSESKQGYFLTEEKTNNLNR
ncbi:response regulator [Sulfurimonas aquatica]|uniref:Response regulator n=1 Tax=Sulfurimonas aquatica TaxID=2672570 RepID=A0A975B0X3_9BACT|nr:response regulator [Sulfurimonas aquatica]QSZ42179.1 response regulator [Sulfurimonas aquatica]